MTLRTSNQLFDAYFTADSMAEVFCDQGRLQGMLDFEAALARAQARGRVDSPGRRRTDCPGVPGVAV